METSNQIKRNVFIGSIPNAQQEDIELTKEIFKKGLQRRDSRGAIEKEFKEKFGYKNIYFLNTGRASLYLILKTIGIEQGDEVITQSFSCMAASQPILWCGATPVFADINEEDFNINVEDIKKKVTPNTRAIVVQHTFGNPGLLKDCVDKLNIDRPEDSKIFLIEDCAHSLGAKLPSGEYVGHQGDFAFFSFSQDKGVSCINGGAVTVNNPKYVDILGNLYKELSELPSKEVKYLLRYQLLWNIIKKTYFFPSYKTNLTLGRLLILVFRQLGLIKQQVDVLNPLKKDIYKLSLEQIELLNLQLSKIEDLNNYRKKIAGIYNAELKQNFRFDKQGIFLRFPILIKNPEEIKNIFKQSGVILGNWYNNPIYPEGVDMDLFNYKYDCPIAENKCKYILNLPTNIEVDESVAKYIVNVINKHGETI